MLGGRLSYHGVLPLQIDVGNGGTTRVLIRGSTCTARNSMQSHGACGCEIPMNCLVETEILCHLNHVQTTTSLRFPTDV
jgi:hypothetical protein